MLRGDCVDFLSLQKSDRCGTRKPGLSCTIGKDSSSPDLRPPPWQAPSRSRALLDESVNESDTLTEVLYFQQDATSAANNGLRLQWAIHGHMLSNRPQENTVSSKPHTKHLQMAMTPWISVGPLNGRPVPQAKRDHDTRINSTAHLSFQSTHVKLFDCALMHLHCVFWHSYGLMMCQDETVSTSVNV